MGSVARLLVTSIRDAVQVDHTIGGGTYDLSGVDQCKIGRFFFPPTDALPFVWMGVGDVAGVAEGVALGRYGRKLTIEVMGFVVADSDSVEDRVLNALDLMNDVFAAAEDSVRTVGGVIFNLSDVIDVVCVGTTFDGDEDDVAPGLGVLGGTIEISYQTTRGV